LRFWVPEPLQGEADLGTGNAHADVSRGNMLDRMRFIKNYKVVLKQNPGFQIIVQVSEVHEKEGVVQDNHIRAQNL
jgi:hypothetical protein